MRSASTLAGSKPVAVRCMVSRLFMSRPAPVRTTSVSATCPAMSAPCTDEAKRLEAPRVPPDLSISLTLARSTCHAGSRPNTRPVNTETVSANSNAAPSTPIADERGTRPGGSWLVRAGSPTAARTMPAAPPARESSRLSRMTARARVCGVAPSARRTASSCRRATPRASMRLARLTQAMSSTRPTAPTSSSSEERRPPTRISSSGCSATPQPRLVLEHIPWRGRSAMGGGLGLGSAECGVRRAGRRCSRSARSVRTRFSGASAGKGSHRSTNSGSRNSSGMTPMMVAGWSSSMMVFPITSARWAKCRRHAAWLSTTVRSAPRLNSSGWKVRPSLGGTPKTGKNSSVTLPQTSWVGSAPAGA